ncbi:hypothetical protein [Micromonospora lutea]|uniref:Uncharacterized protein n=1 Tax=Micromonospora lutea TaxID=419825 RepID=A0ABQ4INN5_9ACTN|nr:hypothetical protein [Micromonospora lutea]GIJ19516.1 hypothetical protein Vlu01_01400 [Micromonospora lutea]
MNVLARMTAAAVPGAVGSGALAALWQQQARSVADCESDTIGGCLDLGFPTLLVGPLVVMVAVWLTLRTFGVEPARWATLVGALASGGLILLEQARHPRWTLPPVWLVVVLAMIGFAVGVFVVTATLPPVVRVALVLVLLAPLAAFPTLRQQARRVDDREAFAGLGLPLLVPRVPGYELGPALAYPADRVLLMTLVRERGWISVYVTDVPDDFAPPRQCGPVVSDILPSGPGGPASTASGCRRVDGDHWIRTESGREVHVVRRDGALVTISPGPDVRSGELATAATTLTAVTPRRLAELSNP